MRVRVMRARLRAYLRVCTCTRLRAYAREQAAEGGWYKQWCKALSALPA